MARHQTAASWPWKNYDLWIFPQPTTANLMNNSFKSLISGKNRGPSLIKTRTDGACLLDRYLAIIRDFNWFYVEAKNEHLITVILLKC